MVKVRTLGVMFSGLIILAVLNTYPAYADSCTVQVGYGVVRTANYAPDSSIGVVVPVLARCGSAGNQLYAVGTAHDTTTNTDLTPASTVLSAGNGMISYTGQLVFNVPSNAVGDSLQVTVNVYSGPSSNPPTGSSMATITEFVPVDVNTKYVNFSGCYYTGACDAKYNFCQSPGISTLLYNNTVQCVGYLFQDPNGCVELVIPVYSPYGLLTYQYYTLQNLPASYPPIGTWVAVTGQLKQGPNTASNGAACPGNYITIASIVQ